MFGARAARAALADAGDGRPARTAPPRRAARRTAAVSRAVPRRALWRYAGLERDGDGLRTLLPTTHTRWSG